MKDDVPVIIGPQSEITHHWLKTYQRRGIWHKQRIDDEMSWIWEGRDSKITEVSDLIPGLPDHLVEMDIWPRIRKHLEEAPPREDPWEPQTWVPDTTEERIKEVLAIFNLSKKWRHLIRSSKTWVALRILSYERPFGYGLAVDNLTKILFERNLRILPPIDTFSREEEPRLLYWFRCWHEFDKEERSTCLELYADKTDRLGRLDNWIRQRDKL